MAQKQLTALPSATEANDDDLLLKRDASSGGDESLSVQVLRETAIARSIDDHASETETHGAPSGGRLVHTGDAGSEYAGIAGGSDANFAAMPQVDGSPIVESGSNSDGEWVRYADGTQTVFGRIVLDSPSTSRLIGTWVFPVSFASGVVPQVLGLSTGDDKNDDTLFTPNISELASLVTRRDITDSTSVVFQQMRIEGMTDFVSGDEMPIDAYAVGEWQ